MTSIAINETININGSDFEVIINKTGAAISPLYIYVKKVDQLTTFGGYVYSIKRRNTQEVSQLTIKSGDCEEQTKSLSYLMCKKYDFPNYVNLNGVGTFDFNFLLMELKQMITV